MKNRWIRELFSFSRTERTGIIALLSVIFLLILAGLIIPLFFHGDQTDFSKWEAEINTYLSKIENKNPCPKRLNLVAFDPNRIDSVSLVDMGLPLNLVVNWVKYLDKGGRFKDKTGIRRIFGMTSQLFEQMDSFILIPEKTVTNFKPAVETLVTKSPERFKGDTIFHSAYARKGKPEEINLELNRTDSTKLVLIRGIGPVLASRIIRYRRLLGGFYAVTQLKEVYGLNKENLPPAIACLSVDPSLLKKFNINFSTVQELGHHPYIGYQTARKLVRLRDKRGKFLSPEDLSSAVSADSLTRLIPYLKFSQ